MKRLLIRSAAALSQLFGIDILLPSLPADAPPIDAFLCPKCKGRGEFEDYLTRKVRMCDRCGGTGLRPV
jgi:hypothetical protein